ncbi:hypothetical protein BDV96DRAFT_498039 [Lophiotrema nucula]|uniref:Putative gamma-glutamylcyclotransferase n=1 Tax=Lophiotrema nucula TaxID=690887 RepID=A0A6A5Z1G4_9PLEO|nr:hypothetical protein BDV96DRAFT_498039 [Lophiotrema nucula]
MALNATGPRHTEVPLVPFYMFFYGSLQDPEVLQAVLSLVSPPTVTPASIEGFAIRMWGIYPALIPCPNSIITGTAWEVTSQVHFARLAEYETEAYTWCECTVRLESGETLMGCRTFCWAGDAESKELEDGTFDLERYQRYFKASITRRGRC